MVTEGDLRLLPAKPGVYLMHGADDTVIYVGKARSLRNRVRSYFQDARPLDPRIQLMVSQVERFEFITTGSELEALALESNLIKQHRPRYNVKLRDDKQYPLMKVTWQDEFPELLIVRRAKNDGARYFGPYTDSGALRDTLRLLRRLFPLRSCKRRIGIDHVDRPCLNHHIHRCLAPCVGGVSSREYRAMIEQVCLFLAGRQDELARELQAQMEEAARNLDFERAALARDRLADVKKVVERQKVVTNTGEDFDVLGLATGPEEALVLVFPVRGGKLIGRKHFLLTQGAATEPAENLQAFIMQYYAESPDVPPLILLPIPIEDLEAVPAWLAAKHGRKVKLLVPQRGEKKGLIGMAMENAAILLEQEKARNSAQNDRAIQALSQIALELGLPMPPRRIEAFDISNILGQEAVASMAVFLDGRPAPSEYRRFKIRTVQGANDFAMLQEATTRRFRRGAKDREQGRTEGFADLPDLVVIDGGKGQLNAVLNALEAIGSAPALMGLAKEREEIYLPEQSEPLVLPRRSEALQLVQHIRDEAHRFAVTYHRAVRAKRTSISRLDGISGIGPGRKHALLRRFGSVHGIRAATVEEIAQVDGMNRRLAETVYADLHHNDD